MTNAYEVYNSMTEEQKNQFHQDWKNYLESFHIKRDDLLLN